jgi:hypothetical protein
MCVNIITHWLEDFLIFKAQYFLNKSIKEWIVYLIKKKSKI